MNKILLLVILMIFVSFSYAEEMNGGFLGFSFGGLYCDTDDLNERFSKNGIKEIKDIVYGWGGVGYGVASNVVFGLSGVSGNIKTESDSLGIKIDMRYWLFETGYLFSFADRMALFPLFGIGKRGVDIYVRPDLGDVDFDEILTPGGAGRTTTISNGGFVGSLGLGALFRLGDFLMLYAKGTYLKQFGGDWNLEDGSMLRNEPDFGFKGPSFSVGIVLGGLTEAVK